MSGRGCAGCCSEAPAPQTCCSQTRGHYGPPPSNPEFLHRISSESDSISESYCGNPAASLCLLINYLQSQNRSSLSPHLCSDPGAEECAHSVSPRPGLSSHCRSAPGKQTLQKSRCTHVYELTPGCSWTHKASADECNVANLVGLQ